VSRNDWKEHAASLVVDEAHNLEESATTALTDEVTEQDVHRLLRSVLDRGRRRGALLRWCEATATPVRSAQAKAVADAVRVAGNAAEQLTATLTDFLRSRAGARRDELERFGASIRLSAYERRRPGFAAVRAAAVSLAAALRDLASQLAELPVPAQLRGRYRRHRLEQELSRAGRRLRDAAETIYLVIAGSNDPVEDAAWIPVADLRIDDGSYTWGLRRVPLSVAPGCATSGTNSTRWS
jgi:Rad3-related DNA helicase